MGGRGGGHVELSAFGIAVVMGLSCSRVGSEENKKPRGVGDKKCYISTDKAHSKTYIQGAS